MTTWSIARCTPKATNPHSAYVKRIDFPLQQRSQKRVPVLGYTYIACLVIILYVKLILYLASWSGLLSKKKKSGGACVIYQVFLKDSSTRTAYITSGHQRDFCCNRPNTEQVFWTHRILKKQVRKCQQSVSLPVRSLWYCSLHWPKKILSILIQIEISPSQ